MSLDRARCWASCIGLAFALSCSQPEQIPAPKRSLVLCVVDTLREDGLASMPFLTELGVRGARVENAYATSSWTRPSLASIFTGRFPSEHGVHEPRQPLPGSERTLAEALREQGYSTRAIVSNPILKEKWGYAQGFESYDDELCLGPSALTSEELAERALLELKELQEKDEPFFLFVLFFDPHWQYRGRSEESLEPVGRLDGSQRTQELSSMELSAEEQSFVRALYEQEVGAVDRALERIIGAVRGDVLVAVTADHGECLGEEHGFFGHVENLREEIVRVPLIFNSNLNSPLEGAFSLASLPGLVLDELGLNHVTGFASSREALFEVDYLPTQFRSAARTKCAGLREGRWKLVVDDLAGDMALFDMKEEGESRDVAGERVKVLREMLERLRAAQGSAGETETSQLSEEDLESLRALGYAGED